MSKIIFLNSPASGHVNPTLPIVQELVKRGEQVLYYNTEDFRAPIERTGADFRPYPEIEFNAAEIADALRDGNIASFGVLLLRGAEQLLPFMLDELTREQPDLLYIDSTVVWGRVAATLLNIPVVGSITTFVLDDKFMAALNLRESLHLLGQMLPKIPPMLAACRRLKRQYGDAFPSQRPVFPMRGGLNLVFTSRGLQPDTTMIDDTYRFVGPSINPQTRAEDFPLDALTRTPLIYISMGTIHNLKTDFYRQCFEAFADVDGQFVMSVGKRTDIASLGTIPSNFMVRPFVPQLEILQHADAFITHGGMNSIHEALYYGVPLVLIPQQIEQLLNAIFVEKYGAGVLLRDQVTRGHIKTADLRQALEMLLSNSNYRVGAQKLQQSLSATGGYQQAADEIQAYITQRADVKVL